MKRFDFNKDITSFISILITLAALLFSINSPEIFSRYSIPLMVILFLVLFIYVINYFKIGIEEHEKEISKINEKINIYKDISDIKAKVELLFINNKMKKRGQSIPVDFIIKIIQIGAIIFAIYVILKALGVNF